MKRLVPVIALAIALVMAGEARAQVAKAPSTSEQTLSKNELQRLATEAKTPGDHARLSEYYVKSAERHVEEAVQYEALAKSYDAHKGAQQPARRAGAAFVQGAQHCRSLAALARKAAAEDRALASLHANAATEATEH